MQDNNQSQFSTLVKDLYSKYSPEKVDKLDDETLSNIEKTYNGDYKTFVSDYYKKNRPDKVDQLNDETYANIAKTYGFSDGNKQSGTSGQPQGQNEGTNEKKKSGFGREMLLQSASGLGDQVYRGILNIPDNALRIASVATNPIARLIGLPEYNPGDINKVTGIENIDEYIANETEKYQKEVKEINPQIEAGVMDSMKKGDWNTGFRNLASGLAHSSMPSLLMMAAPMAGASAGGQIAASTGMFGSARLKELDETMPELSEEQKLIAANINGALEGIFETYFGSGAVGESLVKNIIKEQGVKAGKETVKKGMRQMFSDALTKNPALAPLGEMYEEMGTQVAQNLTDKLTGVNPDIEVTDGLWDAGLLGLAGGATHGGAIKGAQYLSQKVGKKRAESQARQTIQQNLAPITHKDGNVHQITNEQDEMFFVVDETDGGMLTVKDIAGNEKIVPADEFRTPEVKSVQEITEQELAAWEQEYTLQEQMKAEQQAIQEKYSNVPEQWEKDGVTYRFVNDPQNITPDGSIVVEATDQMGNVTPKEFTQEEINSVIQEQKEAAQAEQEEAAKLQEEQQGEQPEEQEVIEKPKQTFKIDNKEFEMEQAEDGSFILNAGQKDLKTIQENTDTDNFDVELITEDVPADPNVPAFVKQKPKQNVKGVKITPKQKQNDTPPSSEQNTMPQYRYLDKQISDKKANALIDMAESVDDLYGFEFENDEKLSKKIEKKFPELNPAYEVNGQKVDREYVENAIEFANTPEKLSKINVRNDQELQSLIEEKEAELRVPNAKETKERALKAEPRTLRELLLQYFVNGGRVNTNDVKMDITGKSVKENQSKLGFVSNNAPSIDQLQERLLPGTAFEQAMDDPTNFRNEVIDVLSSYQGRAGMLEDISELGMTEDQRYDADMAKFMPEVKVERVQDGNKVKFVSNNDMNGVEVDANDYNEVAQTETTPEEEQFAALLPDEYYLPLLESEDNAPSMQDIEAYELLYNQLENERQQSENINAREEGATVPENQENGETGTSAQEEQPEEVTPLLQPQETTGESEVAGGTSEQDKYENSILYKARNGDKEAQQRMQDYGLEWDENPVKHRQIGEKEAEKLLNGEQIKPERNGSYVDISDFPAYWGQDAKFPYKVTFKQKPEFDSQRTSSMEGGRVEEKNKQAGEYGLVDGYTLDDVAAVEKMNENGEWEVIYDSKNTTSEKQNTQELTESQTQQPKTEQKSENRKRESLPNNETSYNENEDLFTNIGRVVSEKEKKQGSNKGIKETIRHMTINGGKDVGIDKTLKHKGYMFAQTNLPLGGSKDYQTHVWDGNNWKRIGNIKLLKKDIDKIYKRAIERELIKPFNEKNRNLAQDNDVRYKKISTETASEDNSPGREQSGVQERDVRPDRATSNVPKPGTIKRQAYDHVKRLVDNHRIKEFDAEYFDNRFDELNRKFPNRNITGIADLIYEGLPDVDMSDNGVRFRKNSPQGFYSTVENALDKINQEKGTVAQFEKMLLKNGAKQTELDWMNFKDHFADTGEKVTKQDIQEWIDNNRIEVEEVKREKYEPLSEEEITNIKQNIEIESDIETRDQFGIDEPIELWDRYYQGPVDEETLNKIAEKQGYEDYDDLFNAMDSYYENLVQEKINNLEKGDDTRFSQYQLPGGENYKEFVLTMPGQIEPYKPDNLHFTEEGGGTAVAWVRAKDYNSDNEKVLFLEEVQSKRAQEGKKNGFNSLDGYSQEQKELIKLGLKWNNQRTTEEENRFRELDDKYPDTFDEWLDRTGDIPDMPFKQTPQWVNLALRRMMRYAAENGYDRIAWTPGEVQADRYDLSKQIESIRYSNDKYLSAFDKNGNKVIDQFAEEHQLPDIIGKEATDKLLSQDSDSFGRGLQNEDLKVGGEGMKTFYDKIIPNQFKKITKKFDTKVEPTTVDLNGEINLDLATDAISNLPSDGQLEVLSIPVTDKMRESVMEGIPLYKRTQKPKEIKPENREIADELTKTQMRAPNALPLVVGNDKAELVQAMAENGSSVQAVKAVMQASPFKAFVDIKTGHVYIDLSMLRSKDDALASWIHENQHRGIRNLIPDSNELNQFFDTLYESVRELAKTDPMYTRVLSEVERLYAGESKRVKADEFFAHLSEKVLNKEDLTPQERTIWQKLVDGIRDILSKIFNFDAKLLSHQDIASIIRASMQTNFQGNDRVSYSMQNGGRTEVSNVAENTQRPYRRGGSAWNVPGRERTGDILHDKTGEEDVFEVAERTKYEPTRRDIRNRQELERAFNRADNKKSLREINQKPRKEDYDNIFDFAEALGEYENSQRFRFVGEWGAHNTKQEANANYMLNHLSRAKEMEEAKKTAKEIKELTGWERGADGKWRFEQKDIDFNPDIRDFIEKQKRLFDIEKWHPKEKKLGDIIDDSDLFAAYPDLKDVDVQISVDSRNKEGGSYRTMVIGDPLIKVSSKTFDGAKSILAHEIQHYIQGIEGFAKGGSENMVKQEYTELLSSIDMYNEYLQKANKESNKELYDKLLQKRQERVNQLQNIRKHGERPIDSYSRLAGEVESRNVQSRMNLTPEERANKLYSETQDVANEDQIFMFDGMGVSEYSPTQTDTPEFKRWFGNSKVVDENGEPLVVYHGTNNNFNEFNPTKQTTTAHGYGFYFATDKNVAQGYKRGDTGQLIEAYLSIKKPLEASAPSFTINEFKQVLSEVLRLELEQYADEIESYKDSFLSNIVDTYSMSEEDAIQEAVDTIYDKDDPAIDQIAEMSNIVGDRQTTQQAVKNTLGYDGIFVKDFQETDGDVFIAWFPTQIKSATGNSGGFDPNNPDIRFRKYAKAPQTDTPEFKRWFGDSKIVDENGNPRVMYHATNRNFDSFRNDGILYFTDNPDYANMYIVGGAAKGAHYVSAKEKELEEQTRAGESIMPVFLKSEKPFDTRIPQHKEIFDNEYFMKWGNGTPLDKERGLPDWTEADDLKEFFDENGYKFDGVILADSHDNITTAVFSPSQVKSATGNQGTFDPGNPDIRFRKDDDQIKNELESAIDEIHKGKSKKHLKEAIYNIRQMIQDKDIPVRNFLKEIAGGDKNIKSHQNAYRDMTLAYGRSEYLLNDLEDKHMNQVVESASKLKKHKGIDNESVMIYMIAKHAPERNRKIREDKIKEYIKNNSDASDEQIEAFRNGVESRDYSGILSVDKSGEYEGRPDEFAEVLSAQFEEKIGNKKEISDFWKAIKGVSNYTLERWKDGNQITNEGYELMKNGYDYYVPLKGWWDDASKVYDYHGSGSGAGKSLKKAGGRLTLPDNPLAYLEQQAFKSITEQVDNEVYRTMLNFVIGNMKGNEDRVQVKKVYYVQKGDGKWDYTLERPDKKMFENGMAEERRYTDHFRMRKPAHAKQHEVWVDTKYGTYAMVFPKDIEVAHALNHNNTLIRGLFGKKEGTPIDLENINRGFSETIGRITNLQKALYTSWNIVFPVKNVMRDAPEAASHITIKYGPKMAANFMAEYGKPGAVLRYLYNKDKFNPKWDENGNPVNEDGFYNDFMSNGGQTGFTHLKEPDQLMKDIHNRIKKAGTKYHKKSLTDNLERFAQIFEDMTRFSAYKAGVKSGMTKKDAAALAKEVSVNFNRKGKITKTFDAIYAFFNAALQAGQKNLKLAKDNPKAFTAVSAGWTLLGIMVTEMNRAMDDDDDEEYERLSPYVRMNYLVFPIEGDKYFRLPLPQFFRGFYAMGSNVSDLAHGKTTTGAAIGDGLLNFLNALSPIDVSGFVDSNRDFSLSPLVPTAASPIVEAYVTNENFMGYPISKEPFTQQLEDVLADSKLHKKNVNPAIKFITDSLFELGGGETDRKTYRDPKTGEQKRVPYLMDINPSKIEHLIKSYTGGTGAFVADLGTTLINATKNEYDIDDMPYVNSFIRNYPAKHWDIIGDYYDEKEKDSKWTDLANSYKKKGDMEVYLDMTKDIDKLDRHYTLKIIDNKISLLDNRKKDGLVVPEKEVEAKKEELRSAKSPWVDLVMSEEEYYKAKADTIIKYMKTLK